VFEEWDGSFWSGYEPFVDDEDEPVSWERTLQRARTLASADRVWPALAADTRTPAERRIWENAASLVEQRVDSPPMSELVSMLRGPHGHKRIAAVIETRFHVPAAIFGSE